MAQYLPKMTVSELTASLKTVLEESFFGLTVEGEISGFRPAPTGHWYFSLKDESAVINAVVWKSMIPSMSIRPKDGMKVIVTGNINLYAARGSYQITCTSMRLSGEGDILAALEEKKRRYSALGYFDESTKKPIPKHPSKVAVVTSPTGAALQDILQVTGRRNSSMNILIMPCIVQGEEAAATIAHRIEQVSTYALADVMIVGRGGGSVEDLLPFSDDLVIEAIHNSQVPVISAVGHEIDWAISDFVADLRAPTPSAAAELVCQSQDDTLTKLTNIVSVMQEAVFAKVNDARLRYQSTGIESANRILETKISDVLRIKDNCLSSINSSVSSVLADYRRRNEVARGKLEALSPEAVLSRGFAIVTSADGKTIRDSANAEIGQNVNIRLQKGKLSAKVTEKI